MTRHLVNPGSNWYTPLDDYAPSVVTAGDNAAKVIRQMRYSTSSVPAGPFNAPFQFTVHTSTFTVPVWVMPHGYPTSRVTWLTQNGNGPPASETANGGLQGFFDAVPVPQDSGLRLASGGTDNSTCIWQPTTDTIWEFWRFKVNQASPYDGVVRPYTCAYGGVVKRASWSTGILPNNWGVAATSLLYAAGVIQMKEVSDGLIGHMVRVGLPVTAPSHLAPATRNDSFAKITAQSAQPVLAHVAGSAAAGATTMSLDATPTGYADGRSWVVGSGATQETVTIAGLSGGVATLAAPLRFAHTAGENVQVSVWTDAVPEGAIFRFPSGTTIPGTLTPFAQTLMTAVRDYGLIIADSAGVVTFSVEDSATLATPYQMDDLTTSPLPGSLSAAVNAIPWEQLVQVAYVPQTLTPPPPPYPHLLGRIAATGQPVLLTQH